MNHVKTFLKITLGLLVLFFGLTASPPRAYASNQMMMHQSGSDSGANCQTRCASSTVVVPATRPDEPEEDSRDPAPQNIETPGSPSVSLDAAGRHKITVVTDARLLRPPDLITLNCVYRI